MKVLENNSYLSYYKQFSADIKMYIDKIKTSFVGSRCRRQRPTKMVLTLWLYIFILRYITFQFCWEPVLIHRILTGFEAILEISFGIFFYVNNKNGYRICGYCEKFSHTLIICFSQLANIKISPLLLLSPNHGIMYWPLSEGYINNLYYIHE